MKILESSLRVKSKEVPDGLKETINPDGYYSFGKWMLVVKFMDSFGWEEAKELWKNWDRMERSSSDFILLLLCKTSVPEAALWIHYVCWKYSRRLGDSVTLVDLSLLIGYSIYFKEFASFLLRLGCRYSLYLVNPERMFLASYVYSDKTWLRVRTLPPGLKLHSDPRITMLKTSPRPYWTINKILLATTIIGLFGMLALAPLKGFHTGLLDRDFFRFVGSLLAVFFCRGSHPYVLLFFFHRDACGLICVS